MVHLFSWQLPASLHTVSDVSFPHCLTWQAVFCGGREGGREGERERE